MTPFQRHHGLVVAIQRDDIDTDQIVPKQFLTATTRTGFARALFHDWRKAPDGTPDPRFPLNQPRYAAASVLVAGRNFGCGSSREHAAWALVDAGFRAVIAPSFGDIFFANAVGNGLLPVVLGPDVVGTIADRAMNRPPYTVLIDLVERRVEDDEGLRATFLIDDGSRDRLLKGVDAVARTLVHASAIEAFERRRAR